MDYITGSKVRLNLFVNDMKTVRLANTDDSINYIYIIKKIQNFLDQCTITEEELITLKRES